jgi:hypothetical protein
MKRLPPEIQSECGMGEKALTAVIRKPCRDRWMITCFLHSYCLRPKAASKPNASLEEARPADREALRRGARRRQVAFIGTIGETVGGKGSSRRVQEAASP